MKMMLYTFCVFVSDIILNPNHLKKLSKYSMLLANGFSHLYSFVCETHSSVFFVSEKPCFMEFFHHPCNTWRGNIEIIGNVNRCRIALLKNKFIDYFEIVFHPISTIFSNRPIGFTN